MVNRVVLIVLDSVGVGYLPDAHRFNDDGVNTLLHIYQARGGLDIPNLCLLGMGKIVDVGCRGGEIGGCYGKMGERSPNKDTTTGHWEIAGIVLDVPFPTYPTGFPPDIIEEFERKIGTKTLGNYPRSGTEILKELGDHHIKTGYPIVYTSADSVFQLAAHEGIVPLETLYEYCRIARNILTGKHAVVRVIARPFRGLPGRFERDDGARRDLSLVPPEETLLDRMKKQGFFVAGVGKIGEIFAHRGLTEEIHTNDNEDGVDKTIGLMRKYQNKTGLIFVNLVDFDMVYGHRRNVEGYARALEEFDRRIPQIMDALSEDDVLIITADHGCDPAYGAHTDHTREYVPLLVCGEATKKNIDLGTRDTFADCGQTIADMLGAGTLKYGRSFKGEISND
ncbi:MAG TPA: phosphopentomutase [Desulfatiglandales bacterium]|nr:phosphopentomutase [Desulfatiglandales bacterium]